MSEIDIESQQATYELKHTIDRLEAAKALTMSLQTNQTSVEDIGNLPEKESRLLTESIRVVRHIFLDVFRDPNLTIRNVPAGTLVLVFWNAPSRSCGTWPGKLASRSLMLCIFRI